MRQLVDQLKYKLSKIAEGGGAKNAAKQKDQGKLLARERIEYLIDKGSEFIEIGAFVADGMYAEYGGCPAAGVVGGIGYVSKKQCVIVANDATVKAGAWFPMSGKKNLRFQEIAMENRLRRRRRAPNDSSAQTAPPDTNLHPALRLSAHTPDTASNHRRTPAPWSIVASGLCAGL